MQRRQGGLVMGVGWWLKLFWAEDVVSVRWEGWERKAHTYLALGGTRQGCRLKEGPPGLFWQAPIGGYVLLENSALYRGRGGLIGSGVPPDCSAHPYCSCTR